MKFLLVLCVLVALAYTDDMEEWAKYKRQFHKLYTNGNDEGRRMKIFLNNKRKVEEHNAKFVKGIVSYSVKINQLSDMEPQEVKAMLNGFKMPKTPVNGKTYQVPLGSSDPDTKDWRNEGAVTNIKDQQQCGSCWAFSAVGSIEGQHFLKTKDLVSLSEQNLVDCSWDQGNMGCSGGWMDQGFEYVKENGGIDTEDSYPYTGMDGNCQYSASNSGATVTGYVDIPTGDEASLKSAVANVGPIAVAIDAGEWSFQAYSGGIYDEPNCSPDMLDHGVLAVGYGTENGQDYWLVKNSWGTSWGDEGYIKMSRNKNNQCGIATKASYPTV